MQRQHLRILFAGVTALRGCRHIFARRQGVDIQLHHLSAAAGKQVENKAPVLLANNFHSGYLQKCALSDMWYHDGQIKHHTNGTQAWQTPKSLPAAPRTVPLTFTTAVLQLAAGQPPPPGAHTRGLLVCKPLLPVSCSAGTNALSARSLAENLYECSPRRSRDAVYARVSHCNPAGMGDPAIERVLPAPLARGRRQRSG
jgi:hypothetical protein